MLYTQIEIVSFFLTYDHEKRGYISSYLGRKPSFVSQQSTGSLRQSYNGKLLKTDLV